METICYSLLFYRLTEDTVLGILVGTAIQQLGESEEQLTHAITEHLQNHYRKYDTYPEENIVNAKMKTMSVKVRPVYRMGEKVTPVAQTLSVPVTLVYGKNQDGAYECFLPLLEEHFVCHDIKLLDTLAQSIAVSTLNYWSPEQLYAKMGYTTPSLGSVSIRVKKNKKDRWKVFQDKKRNYELLNKVAMRYPPSKKVRKAQQLFPDIAWRRQEAVDQAMSLLTKMRANVLIVGEASTGKTTILKTALRKLHTNAQRDKIDWNCWQMYPEQLQNSGQYFGQWQENCEQLIDELRSDNAVLWIQKFIDLLRYGGDTPQSSMAAFLLPFLHQNKLQIVGELLSSEYERLMMQLPAFARMFQVIRIDEMSEEDTLKVLKKLAVFSEQQLRVKVSQTALQNIIYLQKRFIPYAHFPGKATRLLAHLVTNAKNNKKKQVNRPDVVKVFSQQTGLPELFLKDDIELNTKDVHDYFSARIIGQPALIERFYNFIKLFKAGLNNPSKPLQVLLFAGPTGVGKTASAKALASYFFGEEAKSNKLIRIDMSEFKHPSQITELIGGNGDSGKLMSAIRMHPFSVLLLDEVEKADPSIFDALMGVFDEGMMNDAYGRTTNFRNTIIIMTSNLGATSTPSIGFGQAGNDNQRYDAAVREYFRPEIVNRLDEIIIFNPLDKEAIHQITHKELNALNRRGGFKNRNLNLEFSTELIDYIASVGYEPAYGARPVQRAITDIVIKALSQWLLDRPSLKDKTLLVDYDQQIDIQEAVV